MDQQTLKWLEFVQSSSIPLRELGDTDIPVGLGAGCLMDYNGRRFLLSVFHVTRRSARWVIQLGYSTDVGQTEVYYLGRVNYIAEMKKGIASIDEVDFSFIEVPGDLTCQFQHWTPSGQWLVNRPRTIFKEQDIGKPVSDEIYGFAGDLMPEFSTGENALITEHQTYPGLKFVRTEGHYHCFKLPVEHPGHERFKGCSGAPVINTKKKIVGLVCSGSIEKNEIYAVNLEKYTKGIDMLYKALADMNAQPSASREVT